MNNKLLSRAAVSILSLTGLPLAANAQVQGGPCRNAVCSQIVVKLNHGQSVAAINAAYKTSTLRGIPTQRTYVLQLPPQAAPAALQARLLRDNRVAWAEPNHIVVAPRAGTQDFYLPATFNMHMDQYAMILIEADHPGAQTDGPSQIVAVLDTGVDPAHELIVNRIAPGGFNYIDNNDDYHDVGSTTWVEDDDPSAGGHGTMIAGLVLRVAPSAQVLPMRVLNSDGIGTSFTIAQAIYDSIDAGATVINLSLGTTQPAQVIHQAVQAAHASGVVVVSMAGNANTTSPAYYPAAFGPVLAVAGTDAKDVKAPFSDYASYIDISAPAVDITSTFPYDRYASSSGNSFAVALVSGAAARLLAERPDMTPDKVRVHLQMTADEIDSINSEYAGLLGAGRLNIRRALTED